MEINATILVSTVSFIVFIYIMNAILYRPVIEIIEKRQNYIDKNKQEADEHQKKSKALIEDRDNKIADAQRRSRDIVASKSDALKAEKAKVLADTKQTVAEYFNEQKVSLEQQRKDCSQNMKHDIADLANRLTTKLMGEGVAFDPVSDEKLDEIMAEVMKKDV
jgi:F-type H+-transporting ATPase subunit b